MLWWQGEVKWYDMIQPAQNNYDKAPMDGLQEEVN